MDEYKILGVEWRSAAHYIGFVAYATNNPANIGEWNSVVGAVPDVITLDGILFSTTNEENSAQQIAAHGAKIEWNVARELFPNLDITKHKYYPKNHESK